ncbi:MAG: hypothetical protein K6B71_02705 [Alphaproteobacteria bacterium]|nr:hypothetical protein [Alphaproteobacteria bacterium]
MNKLSEELYIKDPNCKIGEQKYVCAGTGNVCRLATDHFTKFYNMVNELSETNSDRIFLHGEENLCTEYGCPVYNIVMKKISEFVKNSAK